MKGRSRAVFASERALAGGRGSVGAASKCTPESLVEMLRQSMASRQPSLPGWTPWGAKRGDIGPKQSGTAALGRLCSIAAGTA
jgi:hypothetical protein